MYIYEHTYNTYNIYVIRIYVIYMYKYMCIHMCVYTCTYIHVRICMRVYVCMSQFSYIPKLKAPFTLPIMLIINRRYCGQICFGQGEQWIFVCRYWIFISLGKKQNVLSEKKIVKKSYVTFKKGQNNLHASSLSGQPSCHDMKIYHINATVST